MTAVTVRDPDRNWGRRADVLPAPGSRWPASSVLSPLAAFWRRMSFLRTRPRSTQTLPSWVKVMTAPARTLSSTAHDPGGRAACPPVLSKLIATARTARVWIEPSAGGRTVGALPGDAVVVRRVAGPPPRPTCTRHGRHHGSAWPEGFMRSRTFHTRVRLGTFDPPTRAARRAAESRGSEVDDSLGPPNRYGRAPRIFVDRCFWPLGAVGGSLAPGTFGRPARTARRTRRLAGSEGGNPLGPHTGISGRRAGDFKIPMVILICGRRISNSSYSLQHFPVSVSLLLPREPPQAALVTGSLLGGVLNDLGSDIS